ncbi:MAG: hypothetical protein QOC70_90 [Verrucomicrobiota bacterium]|jgi:hypothetical protein
MDCSLRVAYDAVPFYLAFDYQAGERYEVPLVNGLSLPVVRMSKNLVGASQ